MILVNLMLNKKILLLVVLVSLLTISAVSAADENVTSDNSAGEDYIKGDVELSDDLCEDENTTKSEFSVISPDVMYRNFEDEITFKSSNDFDGSVEILENAFVDEYSYFYSGEAKLRVKLENLSGNVVLNYRICNYDGNTVHEDTFNVTLRDFYDIEVPDIIYEGSSFKVTFSTTSKLEGDFWCDDSFDGVSFKNGKAVVKFNGFNSGVKTLNYRFVSDGGIWYEDSFNVTVLKKPTIKASNFKKDYTSKSKYRVRIIDNGKYVSGGKVTFYLYKVMYGYDSKLYKTKTVKTDKKGYASVDFDVAPSDYDTTYKIKTKYGPTSVTKKYKINSIVKINKICKYRKNVVKITVVSKKLVFGATLKKVDGKYLKGKKVKFTFYRYSPQKDREIKVKTYTAKTNSKGVAKLTFKKAPIKITSYDMESGTVFLVNVTYGKNSDYGNFLLRSKSPFEYYFI